MRAIVKSQTVIDINMVLRVCLSSGALPRTVAPWFLFCLSFAVRTHLHRTMFYATIRIDTVSTLDRLHGGQILVLCKPLVANKDYQ